MIRLRSDLATHLCHSEFNSAGIRPLPKPRVPGSQLAPWPVVHTEPMACRLHLQSCRHRVLRKLREGLNHEHADELNSHANSGIPKPRLRLALRKKALCSRVVRRGPYLGKASDLVWGAGSHPLGASCSTRSRRSCGSCWPRERRAFHPQILKNG